MTSRIQFKIGTIILILLMALMIMPGVFTGINPYSTESMKSYSDATGKFHIDKAPFKPQMGIPLGTDELGRHIWPLIVYGTRLTLTLALLIVIMRFGLAIPLGFSAGFGGLVSRTIIDKFSQVFGTIPALLLCIIVLKMNFFVELEKQASIFAFVCLLSIVGFGKLGLVIAERVSSLIKEPFVIGEQAIGKSKFQIATGTIIWHIIPELTVLFFLEIARVLTLLLQLGIFGVFVGNVRFIEDTSQGGTTYMNLSFEPEWASMLGAARNNIRVAPWIVFFPALAFFISVIGFNCFGEGLRKIMRKEMDWTWPKKTIKKVGILLLLITILFQSFTSIDRNYGFSLDETTGNEIKFSDSPILVGNENARIASEWIGDELEDKGLYPLNSDRYIHEYDVMEGKYAKELRVLLYEDKKATLLTSAKDYQLIFYGDYDMTARPIVMDQVDLYQYDPATLEEEGCLILDGTFYSSEAIIQISEKMAKSTKVKGLIWLTSFDDLRKQALGSLESHIPIIYMNKRSYKNMSSVDKIEIHVKSDITGTTGRNIYAYLPGSSKRMGKDAILYGFSYNADTKEEFEKKMAFNMGMIDSIKRNHQNRKRTILIAFFDGTMSDDYNGMQAYTKESPYSQKNTLLFVDMTRMKGIDSGNLIFDQNQSPISRYFAYSFSLKFKEKFEKKKIEPKSLVGRGPADRLLYTKQGIPTLIFGFEKIDPDESISMTQLGRLITGVIKSNNY